MANPWFRLYFEFATDPKVQMLSEVDQRRYVMTLCFRCSNVDKTLDDSSVAFMSRIEIDDWMKSKATLIDAGLIDEQNRPTGWDKRQYLSDSSTERSRRFRERQKQSGNVAVTPPDTDTDTDTDINTDNRKKKTLSLKKKTVPYKKIIDLYHELLPELPAVAKLTAKRKTQIRQRFNEDLVAMINWENYFNYVKGSDFLMGKVQPENGRVAFRADLEWLTNTNNFIKISENKYHV